MNYKKIISFIVILIIYHINYTSEMLIEVGAMTGGMVGAQIADQTVTEEMSEMFKALSNNQTNINNAISGFQRDVASSYKKELHNIATVFQQAKGKVSDLQKSQQVAFEQLNSYILKTVDIQPSPNKYLTQAVSFDELFTLGDMYTPKGPIWKNIFQTGNWGYDDNKNSFWQYNIHPFLEKKPDGSLSSDRAAVNSIFTEYITREDRYEISGTIVVHNISYPFFVGVMFNKARWISGNIEPIKKCRLLGLYGTSNKDIGLYFAEQYTEKLDSAKNKKSLASQKTLPPLDQIEKGLSKSLLSFPSTLFDQAKTSPVTFNFSIKTSASKIQYQFWKQGTKQPTSYQTINNLHPDLFLYHSIGFISPGALAEFTLSTPKNLVFKKENIVAFSDKNKTKTKSTLGAITSLASNLAA